VSLRPSCAKVREPIELPFEVMSGIVPGSGVLDVGPYTPSEGSFGFLSGPLVEWIS